MEISYNLRYQKQNFLSKTILDKEGEIIIYGKGFRLKGKGATDRGELINFSEIKEFYHRNEKVFFITFNKEKYILSEAGTQFNQLVSDLFKSRNEFLIDALFMKGGKLKAEFDGNFQRTSKFGNPINKGRGKLRLYEKSLVIVPNDQDAFCVQFNFVNFYEFDELDYLLKIVLDDGLTIFISQLGNDYEFFQEKMEELLGGMYESLVNDILKEIFMQFHAATLLKLAYRMKGGKVVSKKEIDKMDKELGVAVENFIFGEDEDLKKKMKIFDELVDESSIFYGIAKDEAVQGGFIRWLMYSIPSHNLVAFCILPRWKEGVAQATSQNRHDTYFYKIIMEKGSPIDKVEDKILEIQQALVTLRFAKDPCYKDKRELKHSPYQYAIRKMPYLRILRKSYSGKADSFEVKDWQKQVEDILKRSEMNK